MKYVASTFSNSVRFTVKNYNPRDIINDAVYFVKMQLFSYQKRLYLGQSS